MPPPSDPQPSATPPERLGRYRLVRPISTGGMARVFEGRRESLAGVSPRVAVKVILPDFAADAGFQRLFVNEARIGSQLQHQNLVQIQDFDRQGEHFYLVMEFVDGLTLRRAIGLCRKHGMLIPVPVIAELGRQVCDGLHYAHTACGEDGHPLRLVHRDIKPSNLMINGQGVVKVLDFGISRALFSRERQGTVKGTWGYMAPEQASGQDVGPGSDVFGLASVLYELATLRPLFPEREPKDLRAALAADEGAKRAIGLGGPAGVLAPVLVRALQRDPRARFASALDFQRTLGALLANPVTAREQLVHFWATLMELQGEIPGGAYRSQASIQDRSSRGSGHLSSHASHASLVPPASQPSQAAPEAAGLQVAVGGGPADLDLGEPIADEPSPSGRSSRLLWVLLTLVVAGVLVFAGSRVLHDRRAKPASQPGGDVPVASLGALLGAIQAEDEGESLVAAVGSSPEPEPVAAAPRPTPVSPRPSPAPVRAPVPSDEDPVPSTPSQVADAPGGSPARAEDPASEPVPEEVAAAEEAEGMLTVSSLPRSQVSIDGRFVGWAPLLQHPLGAGVHTVTLVAEDGRRYTFRVSLEEGEEVRKVWHFDQSSWVEQ
jgi:serine/threonine protein kinase